MICQVFNEKNNKTKKETFAKMLFVLINHKQVNFHKKIANPPPDFFKGGVIMVTFSIPYNFQKVINIQQHQLISSITNHFAKQIKYGKYKYYYETKNQNNLHFRPCS